MSFKISWKIHLLCFIISCGVCYILYDLLNKISFDILTKINITNNVLLDYTILIFVIFIPITNVHEALHGAAYTLFGGKVKFGFKYIYAYTQETSGIALHRNQHLIVLMTPVMVISVVSILIGNYISMMVFILN